MKHVFIIAFILCTVLQVVYAAGTNPVSRAPDFASAAEVNSHIVLLGLLSDDGQSIRHIMDSLYYCNLVTYSAIGLTGGGTFEGAVRLTPTELGPYTGWKIVAIVFRHFEGSLNNVVKVYDNGTSSSPGSLITSEPYISLNPGWKWVTLSNPVTIAGSGDLWCSVEVNHVPGDYPLAVDAGPAVNGKGDWIGQQGTWEELQDGGLDYNWQILAIVQLFLDDDVEPVSIDVPSVLQPDTAINPKVTVANVGLSTNTFNVTCKIEPGGYSSVAVVTNLAPEDTTQVTFPAQFTFPVGDYTMMVYTQLTGDGNPANDTIVKDVEVYWNDVLPVSIDIPNEVPADTTFRPQATVTNVGTYSESFLTSCRIEPGGYYKNFSVSNLAPHESLHITFNQDFTFTSGLYTVRVYTRLSDDHNPSNDTLEKSINAIGIAEEFADSPKSLTLCAPTICRHDVEIDFSLPNAAAVDLLVYDALGRLSAVLATARFSAGHHRITTQFDLPAGVYFCHLKTDAGATIVRKFLIAK